MKKIDVRSVPHGSGLRYMNSTKIEAAEAVLIDGYTATDIAKEINVSNQTVNAWVIDYKEGKFKIENTTQVNRKKVKSYILYLKEIEEYDNQIEILTRKKALSLEEAKEAWEKEKKEMDEKFSA